VKLIRHTTLVTMIPRKSGSDLVPRVAALINFTVGDAARVTPKELAAQTTKRVRPHVGEHHRQRR